MKIQRRSKLVLALVLVFFMGWVCYVKMYKYLNTTTKENEMSSSVVDGHFDQAPMSLTLSAKLKAMLCKPSPTWQYPPPAPARTINFPLDKAVGSLYLAAGTQSYGYDGHWDELFGEAKGVIQVPEGTAVCLELKEGFGSILSKLEPNSVQSIDFSAPFDLPFEFYVDNQTKRTVRLLDEDLEPIKNLNGLYQLVLHNTTITDKSLSYISEVKSLRLLNLWNTKITDEGLVYLAQLPSLDTIYLGATNISDNGLKYISTLTRLRCLSLTGSNRQKGKSSASAVSVNLRITDTGIFHLKSLVSLCYLNIANTDVSDKSIAVLSLFNSLSVLNVSGTKLTDAGIAKLKIALPNCQIVTGSGMR